MKVRKWLKLVTCIVDGIGKWLEWCDANDIAAREQAAREHRERMYAPQGTATAQNAVPAAPVVNPVKQ